MQAAKLKKQDKRFETWMRFPIMTENTQNPPFDEFTCTITDKIEEEKVYNERYNGTNIRSSLNPYGEPLIIRHKGKGHSHRTIVNTSYQMTKTYTQLQKVQRLLAKYPLPEHIKSEVAARCMNFLAAKLRYGKRLEAMVATIIYVLERENGHGISLK